MKPFLAFALDDVFIDEFLGKFEGLCLRKDGIELRVSARRLVRILTKEFEDYKELAIPKEKDEQPEV